MLPSPLRKLVGTAVYWTVTFLPNIKKHFIKKKARSFSRRRRVGLHIRVGHHPGWEPTLRRAFQDTPHTLYFESLPDSDLSGFDLVLPFTVQELSYLGMRQDVSLRNPIAIPDARAIEICDDKLLFYQTMHTHGFGGYTPKVGGHFNYPYVLKKRLTHCGLGSEIIYSPKDEKRLEAQLDSAEYFKQEYIQGHCEYATHILFQKGEIVTAFTIKHRHSRKIYIRGFEKCESVYSVFSKNRFLSIFADILKAIRFEGICCFDYKIAGDRPLIMEINPRIGGSSVEYILLFINGLETQKSSVDATAFSKN